MKLSLCMIVKNEAENLPACLGSVRDHVDEIIVVDTGSSDNTRAVAEQFGAKVFDFNHVSHPQFFYIDDEAHGKELGVPGPYSGDVALADFAAARNESFKHATGDYIAWMDADDVLERPEMLRQCVATLAKENVPFGFLPYNYAVDDKGRVYYRQWRERIFKRGSGSWSQPVHEVYMPERPQPPIRFDFPVFQHRRKADRKSIPNRNYKILLRQLKKATDANQKPDPRTLFYAGQEARFIEPVKAVAFYNEYLEQSGWGEERAAAHVAIGTMMEFGILNLPRNQAYAHADREYAAAAAEMPDNPDGLFGLARIAYLRGRHEDCIRYSERAFAIGNTESMLGANPMDRLYRPHVFYNHALAMVGRLEDAIKSCEAGLAIAPDDPGVPGGAPGMLKNNIAVYQRELAKRDGAKLEGKPVVNLDKSESLTTPPASIPTDAKIIWSVQLWKHHMHAGRPEKAAALLDALPEDVKHDPLFQQMVALTRGAAPTEKRDIVFYLGPGVEFWDPETPNKEGLGGSETAAIEMAKNLQALGRKVTVYAEAQGVWDGVEYLHHSQFKGADCRVFVASRTPWAINRLGPVKTDLSLLWVHDIHCGPPNPELELSLWQFDRILCLSEWHKEYFLSVYKNVDPQRVIITRNGIDPERFHELPEKTNRMVWSSSPNRGLIRLLAAVREIRKEVPDAAVDIFYGFNTWETMSKAYRDEAGLKEIARYRAEIEQAEREGIAKFHGRRPQTELAQAFLKAKLWAYPTDFPETSCISAMEAQAAGCVVVATKFAALAETVKHGVLIEPAQLQSQFVGECIKALRGQYQMLGMEAHVHAWNNLSWIANAEDWLVMFERVGKEIEGNPIPQWTEAA